MSERFAEHDPRLRAAWQTWLSALAVDPEAAVAAALAYESLPPEGRDGWLDALATDVESVPSGVPPLALYAPLFAVEIDLGRKARIEAALAARGQPIHQAFRRGPVRALCGRAPTGEHVCLLLSPLYLDFVAVLVCRYRPDHGVLAARRDPIRHLADILGRGPRGEDGGAEEPLSCTFEGVSMLENPLGDVVEDLAHAIVADSRQGRSAPEVFGAYADLFVPDLAEHRMVGLPPSWAERGGPA
jgi:hypothetical protein